MPHGNAAPDEAEGEGFEPSRDGTAPNGFRDLLYFAQPCVLRTGARHNARQSCARHRRRCCALRTRALARWKPPSTTSLPWRFRGGTGVRARAFVGTFVLQIGASRCVTRARACPHVLWLMYPSRTRGVLADRETSNTCQSDSGVSRMSLEVVLRRASGCRHSGCRTSCARSRAASCATLARISGGTSGLIPATATASSTSPSSTSPPGGSRPSRYQLTLNSTRRSKRLDADARMCGPRCERSSLLATPQTPRRAAAESAPRPQSPAVAKTTPEPASICRFAILSQVAWLSYSNEYSLRISTPRRARRTPVENP